MFMNRISRQADDLTGLSSAFGEVRKALRYHTESGFTMEEANGYAQQLDDVGEILFPAWRERLDGASYRVYLDCSPRMGGYVKVRIAKEGADPVVVFAESYARFNSEMCDGSCYQYVYQKVLCYQDALESGRVAL
jgi:hypothetical protein